ncbi:MAG: DUF2252 family protein [Candidatus Sericytochromatia bacterium]
MKASRAVCLSLSLLLLAACQNSPPPAYRSAFPGAQVRSQASSPMRNRDVLSLIQTYHQPLQQRSPELVALKYTAMRESAFAFYRATAFLYYQDLKQETPLASGPSVPLQGDFHLENMGTYLTSRGEFAYDLNDFDEAVQGPAAWDLARLAISIHLAAEPVGLKKSERQELIAHFLNRYVAQLQNVQRQPGILQQVLDERLLSEKPAQQVQQARTRFSRSAWLQEMTDGRRLRLNDKVRAISASEAQRVSAGVQLYARSRREDPRFFTLKDSASRIAGKGSLGRYRYLALVEGASLSPSDDLILEIKEAASPSAAYALPSRSVNQASRIVQAWQQGVPGADPYLGVTALDQLPAYVRELLPKETVNLEKVNKAKEYRDLLESVALIIARLHARSGHIPALLQQAQSQNRLIAAFADSYTEQVQADFEAFRRSGL